MKTVPPRRRARFALPALAVAALLASVAYYMSRGEAPVLATLSRDELKSSRPARVDLDRATEDVPGQGIVKVVPGAAGDPTSTYKARPEGEWDGMLVDLAVQPPCVDGGHCGLARACIADVCTACERDLDCDRGEACVLDHCLRQTQVRCHSSQDCPVGEKCVLSGYSPDPRGNAGMSADCIGRGRGSNKPQVSRAATGDNNPARETSYDDELRRAKEFHPNP
jgi:hypothetical protein